MGRLDLQLLCCHPDQVVQLDPSNHPGQQGLLVLLVLWVLWVQCCHPDQLGPFLQLSRLGQWRQSVRLIQTVQLVLSVLLILFVLWAPLVPSIRLSHRDQLVQFHHWVLLGRLDQVDQYCHPVQ